MREFVYLTAVTAMATIVSVAYSTECPDYEPAFIPHETDCGKYYKCHMGKKFNFTCDVDTMGRQLCFVEGHENCGWWRDCNCLRCRSLEDNHKWPDPSNEHAYYQCKNGVVENIPCPTNEVFDPTTLKCQPKSNDTCPPPGSGQVKRYPHLCFCEKYYECKGGQLTLQECPDGLWFDVDLLTCRSKEDARCNNKPPFCLRDGAYPSQTSCYYYYKCVNGVKTTHKCPYGMIFHKEKLVCVNWDKGICDGLDFTTPDPNSCIGWERPRKPNQKDCNRYYECVNGNVEDVKCLQNHYFNEKTLLCDLKKNVNCKNKDNGDCPAVDCGKVRYPHGKCEWYYECRNGNKEAFKCPSGLAYNKNSEMCDLPANVHCKKSSDCPSGSLHPHECQCDRYYTCGKNEEKILSHCPPGKNFDEVTLSCVPPELAKCHKEHKNASFNQNVSHWLH